MSASHFPPLLFVDILPISISTAAVFEHIHLLSILFAEFERIPTDKPTWPFPVVVRVVPFSSFYSFLVSLVWWFDNSPIYCDARTCGLVRESARARVLRDQCKFLVLRISELISACPRVRQRGS
jgi:hypothetical protein